MPPRLTRDDIQRRRSAVENATEAERNSFTELVKLARLDPSRDLRFSDFARVSFKGQNLEGYDFTGCILHGCSFEGASIAKANFSQAELGRIVFPVEVDGAEETIARISDPQDAGEAVVTSWRSGKSCNYDSHLSVGAVFQDAWFSPQTIVVRFKEGRFAVGRMPIMNFEWSRVMGLAYDQNVLNPKIAFKDVFVDEFLPSLNNRLNLEAEYRYRLPSIEEGNALFSKASTRLTKVDDRAMSPYGVLVYRMIEEGLDAGVDRIFNFHTKWVDADRGNLSFRVIRKLRD